MRDEEIGKIKAHKEQISIVFIFLFGVDFFNF